MILADTSIWVSHFRYGNPRLEELLLEGEVICHPFIIGELACGNLKNRQEILSLLKALPTAKTADHKEILYFIEKHRLMGIGLGYVDAHLLASALLSTIPLWTKDENLKRAALKLKVSYG
ncbi:MAG: type II toxin-antitoxin system VapC family toxin [Candidatus Aminicenantes bacterium]|nr:MAG: type II toxin-antitoxin system VapC family toxin [Candidatus Aminicenantes bacterium]